MITRLQLMTAHTLLAAFILPAAIMFMSTGALYTWGIKGAYQNDVYKIQLSQAIQPNLTALTELAETEIAKLNLKKPSGKPKLKTAGNHFMLEWTGSSKDLILEPSNDELTAQLTIKNTSWYRNLVQLHKAKGGVAFKVYAVIFSISLGLLLCSGFIMAWQTPKLKRMALISSLIGAGSFIAVVLLS